MDSCKHRLGSVQYEGKGGLIQEDALKLDLLGRGDVWKSYKH